ncbi:MAG: TRAP transporter small permease [Proteobacteria bacterium]|nr:TRAP transporter small permease [Pseudomonadota bacterium]
MPQASNGDARPADRVGRALYRVSDILAVIGGLLCCVMATLVTVSVTGRYLFASPVPGDYDLLGILGGCAIFAFLPYCQIKRGNIVVDFFTTGVSPRGRSMLDGIGSALYLFIAVLFTWRLYFGAIELYETSEVLAVINFYRWWTLPFSLFCMVVLIAVIAYSFFRDIGDVRNADAAAGKTNRGE